MIAIGKHGMQRASRLDEESEVRATLQHASPMLREHRIDAADDVIESSKRVQSADAATQTRRGLEGLFGDSFTRVDRAEQESLRLVRGDAAQDRDPTRQAARDRKKDGKPETSGALSESKQNSDHGGDASGWLWLPEGAQTPSAPRGSKWQLMVAGPFEYLFGLVPGGEPMPAPAEARPDGPTAATSE